MNTDDNSSTLIDDEIFSNGGDDDNRNNHRQIINTDQFDIKAYASLYSGRTKIFRLLFIAKHCGDNLMMQLEALRMAFDEIKQGEDTSLMREVVSKIKGRLGPNYTVDDTWYFTIDKKAKLKKEKLETELNSFRTN
ncbi:unnamed protein product [Lathyrus sativus]|nr:unnamed protein product [Lathyrus sativus]